MVMKLSKEEARKAMAELVSRFDSLYSQLADPAEQFSETETRAQYIDQFLEILGWDVSNRLGAQNYLAEVVMERNQHTDTDHWGRPDYILRSQGNNRIPIEAKKVSVNIRGNADAARQARSYGWTLSLPASVLTNFATTIIFDTKQFDADGDADYAVIPGCSWDYTDYIDNFDRIWELLSYETVSSSKFFDTYKTDEDPRGTSDFDSTFLSQFRSWRYKLAASLHETEPTLSAEEISRRTQRILNALLFLRVCEDRNIIEYANLLQTAEKGDIVDFFKKKDILFNAGLFSILKDTKVNLDVLIEIIRELYWPKSKFAFSLLEPEILAHIYEQYLSERVIFDSNGIVNLEKKPEVIHSGGVARTPIPVVEALLDEAMSSLKTDNLPRILDPAVGSGVFLLVAFRRLCRSLEESSGSPLNLRERGDLAKKCVYGVDIDAAAVEVTRLSILLAVIGDSRESLASNRHILPDLRGNLFVGNSVVGPNFDSVCPGWASDMEVRATVAPFDFPKGVVQDGFDIIAMNPPYVRIQSLSSYAPAQLQYLQSKESGFTSGVSSLFDLSFIFIERAFQLLTQDGILAAIVPNRILQNNPASYVRSLLAPRIRKLVDFGTQQVFAGHLTYTCLLIAGSPTKEPLVAQSVLDYPEWSISHKVNNTLKIERSQLGSSPWNFNPAKHESIFAKLEKNSSALLGDEASVFVGVQSSADEIFFLRNVKPDTENPQLYTFTDISGRIRSIERDILRPCIKDVRIALLDGQPNPDRYAIFPYEINNKNLAKPVANLLSKDSLKSNYPLAYEYLLEHKRQLSSRSISPSPGDRFWAYGRSQSLTKLEQPKLVVRVLSKIPSYALDTEGMIIPGGGDGGPYYLLRPNENSRYTLGALQIILSHPVVDALITSRGKKFRGDYAVHRKANLVTAPLPNLPDDAIQQIDKFAEECRELAVRLRTERDERMIAAIEGRRSSLQATAFSIISDAFKLTDQEVDLFI